MQDWIPSKIWLASIYHEFRDHHDTRIFFFFLLSIVKVVALTNFQSILFFKEKFKYSVNETKTRLNSIYGGALRKKVHNNFNRVKEEMIYFHLYFEMNVVNRYISVVFFTTTFKPSLIEISNLSIYFCRDYFSLVIIWLKKFLHQERRSG